MIGLIIHHLPLPPSLMAFTTLDCSTLTSPSSDFLLNAALTGIWTDGPVGSS